MDNWSRIPTERFTGLAEKYARYRPSYPREAVDYILSKCNLEAGSLTVDVGCGTGISSRLMAQSKEGLCVIGIEPNEDMLKSAEPAERVEYRTGTAEATGLQDGVADAVLCAQAFHWFDKERALREFHRLLKAGAWVVLIWNERDESDPFTGEYGVLIRAQPETRSVEVPRGLAGQALLDSDLFEDASLSHFGNKQIMDEEGLLGRAFSASYAPREEDLAQKYADDLRKLFLKYQRQGQVELIYQTSVYTGRKKA